MRSSAGVLPTQHVGLWLLIAAVVLGFVVLGFVVGALLEALGDIARAGEDRSGSLLALVGLILAFGLTLAIPGI